MEEPTVTQPRGSGGRRAVAATGRGVKAAGRGLRSAATATGHGASFTFHQARRASHAEGAGDTGLYRLIELHAFNSGGDAALAIALAGTIFFAQPGEARGHVALFLGLTMVPFAVVAPLLGPFLDRFSHGRRWAIGITMGLRAVLCLLLAGAVGSSSVALYPLALGCLVASKAYGVTRAAAVPRLLPERLTLVKANGRISLAGVVGGGISAPLAAGATLLGTPWALRYACLVFVGGTVLAVLLPSRADSTSGEHPGSMRLLAKRRPAPRDVVFALRCNTGLRLLSGFLTMYMAFLLRQRPFSGWENHVTILMALVIGAAGLGNAVGIGAGSLLRRINPRLSLVAVLLADAGMAVLAAVFYDLVTAVLLGLAAGVCQAIGKLALDSTIQRDVPEQHRTSAFARSETLLQLSWVIGGFIGIALPLIPQLGLGVLAGLMVSWTAFVLVSRRAEPSRTERPG
ncbi:MAG: MFS transporter [Marmoricola sp.]